MTTVTYEASAAQMDFQVTFDYISEAHLAVSVNAVATTDFTVASEGLLTLGGSHTILDGDVISIQRITPTGELIADFASPSTVRSGEIRTGFRQMLFIAQEILARSLTGLLKSLSGTRWNAEGLIMESLGEPESGDHAATKAYVDGLAAQAGVLPALTVDDLGKGIRIRSDGGAPSYLVGPINGATTTYKIPATLVDAGAQAIEPQGTGISGAWLSHADTKMPLEIESISGEPTYGTFGLAANTEDMMVPRGTYIVTAEGPVRSLTRVPSALNQCSASVALVTSTGTVIDVQPLVQLGMSGGGYSRPTPVDPYPAQVHVKLTANVTFLGTTLVNLRMSGSTSTDDVVADIPWRVRFEEVVN